MKKESAAGDNRQPKKNTSTVNDTHSSILNVSLGLEFREKPDKDRGVDIYSLECENERLRKEIDLMRSNAKDLINAKCKSCAGSTFGDDVAGCVQFQCALWSFRNGDLLYAAGV